MNSSSLVTFRGDWSPDEQKLVEAAAADAEEAGLPPCPDDTGAPWMAVRTVLNERLIYAASRMYVDDGLLGQAPSDLAARIRQLAGQEGGAEPESTCRSIFQLAYESRATEAMTEGDLRDILRQSRSSNAEFGITGLLVHARGRFLQVLEGPEPAVRDLYATIREDPRHEHVDTLHSTMVAERSFPEWKMALENLAVVAGEEGVSPFLQTGELPASAPAMNGLMGAIDRFRRATVGDADPDRETPEQET